MCSLDLDLQIDHRRPADRVDRVRALLEALEIVQRRQAGVVVEVDRA